MTIQSFIGESILPEIPLESTLSEFYIDASGEKSALLFAAAKTGTITGVTFRTGAVVYSQTLKISLQGVDSQGMPDGSIKASGSAYATQTSPASNTFYAVTFGSPASVTKNDPLSIVIEFDSTTGGVWLGRMRLFSNYTNNNVYSSLYTTSWGKQGYDVMAAGAIYDDSSYGCGVSFPCYSTTQSNGYLGNEIGNYFKLPFPARVSGLCAHIDQDASTTALLYDSDGTTVLASGNTPQNFRSGTSAYRGFFPFTDTASLAADTWYRMTLRSDWGTNTITQQVFYDVSALSAFPLGANCYHTEKPYGGAWSQDTTKRSAVALLVSGFDAGGGSETILGNPTALLGGYLR